MIQKTRHYLCYYTRGLIFIWAFPLFGYFHEKRLSGFFFGVRLDRMIWLNYIIPLLYAKQRCIPNPFKHIMT